MNLNEKILDHRKKLGLSQEELANQLGVTRQAVSKWELGDSQPDLDMIVKLAQLFHVSTDYLLSDAPEESQGDWLDRLPGAIGKLFRRFGWLSGVYLALIGLGLAIMGLFTTASVNSMTGMMTGFDDFPSFDITGSVPSEISGSPFQLFQDISIVLLIIGGILTIGGIVLAIFLKRRNRT